MKFTLKDYQDEAVRDVLYHLGKARKRWHEDHESHAFSLTAATGAGKTVMAAAVFEALFHGDDNYEFNSDPGAVVIWFSDDPSLNEQTRFRLIESSDRLRHTELVVVENSFNRERFETGKVYFLNTQKLSKKSLLVRGFEGDEDGQIFPEMRPDLRAFTIWDTIRNTIEDPALTLYLVLDEAHRGMGDSGPAMENEKTTIVKRLINGEKGVPAIPVAWGISATVERFNKAMEVARGRTRLPDVRVDAARVQDSGLLKDTIALDIPDEVGKFDSVLVRRAVDKLKESTVEWASYAEQQGIDKIVVPLMVLQVPNKPNHGDIGGALDSMFQRWPDLPENCIAHVFGEHSIQHFGRHVVPYVSPEYVQDQSWIRVLIAKDAISTGWDCPRAEVMVSFRSAVDRTHIMQLLGRMVRTPLARRIPGNDRLNSVDWVSRAAAGFSSAVISGWNPERALWPGPARFCGVHRMKKTWSAHHHTYITSKRIRAFWAAARGSMLRLTCAGKSASRGRGFGTGRFSSRSRRSAHDVTSVRSGATWLRSCRKDSSDALPLSGPARSHMVFHSSSSAALFF